MKDVQRIGGRKRAAWLRHVVAGLALGLGAGGTLHAADFQFDEAALQRGADFWEQLARLYRP